MEFKGTKGKWVARFKPENPLLIDGTIGNPIANTFYDDGELIALSNAQLIAHAPEMLEKLSECKVMFSKGKRLTTTDMAIMVDEITDLLTKATTI